MESMGKSHTLLPSHAIENDSILYITLATKTHFHHFKTLKYETHCSEQLVGG